MQKSITNAFTLYVEVNWLCDFYQKRYKYKQIINQNVNKTYVTLNENLWCNYNTNYDHKSVHINFLNFLHCYFLHRDDSIRFRLLVFLYFITIKWVFLVFIKLIKVFNKYSLRNNSKQMNNRTVFDSKFTNSRIYISISHPGEMS